MKDFFIEILQTAINRYLALDPESEKRLNNLNEKNVTIELLGVNVIFQLYFSNNKIFIRHENFSKADVVIKGTPLRLIQMSFAKHKQAFFAEDVSIEGNAALGQHIIDLFDLLEIDWEEYLSRLIGDVAAHQIGQFARGIKQFRQKTKNIFFENINEYLHEEINVAPTKEALQDFFEEIDDIRLQTDRLDFRIQQLEKSLQKNRGNL